MSKLDESFFGESVSGAHQPSGLRYRDKGHSDVANVTGRLGSPQRTAPAGQPIGQVGLTACR